MSFDLSQLLGLDPIEKLKIIIAIEDSLMPKGPILLTPEQKAEIRRRDAEMDADPNSGLDWETVERYLDPNDSETRNS